MSNPVLVEVVRGRLVESRHRGAVAVADADGAGVLSLGDVSVPVFPRSAIKAVQALVLVESGAADRFAFGAQELALACASHGGEAAHVAGVERMLMRAGFDVAALKCGAHWPLYQPALLALARTGHVPSALHNNCSGKHAGFLCAACAMGADADAYISPDHPVQREIRSALEALGGVRIPDEHCAMDGCSAPTWAMPLDALARAFARFGSGNGLAPARADAARRLRHACAAEPWYVAGTARFCTDVMMRFGERVLVKAGAEGVLCAYLAERGFGIAVKCDDGASRAAQVAMAALLLRLVACDDNERSLLTRFARPRLTNWRGAEVGALRPALPLERATSAHQS